ncbi:MAG TPA: FHA domain-containing protein [Gaiellaceae bacterium]|nr:FHA domain-containing protein [Gaiellaceae bacterium]
MTIEALAADETLLVLKIAFVVLLYAFIVLVVRTATKGMTEAPQESIVLGAAEAEELRARLLPRARFAVVAGDAPNGESSIEIVGPTVVGRDAGSGVHLDDEFASARHARIDPRPDGTWIEDLGSTNGTYVNGERVIGAHPVAPGDVVRIGETELRLEP